MSTFRRNYSSFYRPRAGYRRGYNRFWRRRGWYRSSVLTRQRRGTRQFTVVFPIEDIYSLTIAANANMTEVWRSNPLEAYDGTAYVGPNKNGNAQCLIRSEAYRRFCSLYDQCKINYVSHTLSVCDPLGNGTLPALKVYTSWDRDFNTGDGVPSQEALLNGPESDSRIFVNNSRAVLNRFCGARDLSERTQFFDCSFRYQTNSSVYNIQFDSGQTRGCFVPSLCMFIQTSNTTAAARSIAVHVSSRVSVTFRNPKFGLSGSSPGRGVEFAPVGDKKEGGDDTIVVDDVEMEEKGPDTEEKGGDTEEKEVRTDMTDEEISALLEKLRVSKEKA